MRRALPLLAAALAACVAVETLPETRGAIQPGQRLVVLVYQAPGPWIISEADSKAEAAAKLLPVGFLVQTMQDDRVLAVSKDMQQYLPRLRYGSAFQASLIKALKEVHDGPVQTAAEAGLDPAMLAEWNRAKDQKEWRERYFAPDPMAGPPRDYSRILSLDDAVVIDVNLSFGADAEAVEGEQDIVRPTIWTATRLYRGGTARKMWEREDKLSDMTSSKTMVEFRVEPALLARQIEALALPLGQAVAQNIARGFQLVPPSSAPGPAEVPRGVPPPPGPGLLDLSAVPVERSSETAVYGSTPPAPAPPSPPPAEPAPAPAPAENPTPAAQ